VIKGEEVKLGNIAISSFPSTGGRELKGGGIIKAERKGFNPFLSP